MKKKDATRFFVLPACLLVLHLVNRLATHVAREHVPDPFLLTLVIIAWIVLGSGLVAFAVSPALEAVFRELWKGSRTDAGVLGEIVLILAVALLLFWAYYTVEVHGPESLLP